MHYAQSITGLAALLATVAAIPLQSISTITSSSLLSSRGKTGQSKGVKLLAKNYPPSPSSPNEKYYLTARRISQGVNIAIVAPGADHAPVFWENNVYKTQVLTDVPGVYPLGIVPQFRNQFDAQYPLEHSVGLVPGLQGSWLQITPDKGLSGPFAPPYGQGDAEYMVCERVVRLGGAGPVKLQVVRIRYAGEDVPEGCVVVEFVPECAVLEELPEGSSWDHDHAVTLGCNV